MREREGGGERERERREKTDKYIDKKTATIPQHCPGKQRQRDRQTDTDRQTDRHRVRGREFSLLIITVHLVILI